MQVKREPLSASIKTGWAIGELAIAAYVGVNMAFMLYYCTDALRIPPAIAGVALFVPRLLVAFADPIMGVISDRTGSRLGRRRFYLAIGAPFLGLAVALLFFVPPSLALQPKVAFLVLAFLLSNAAMTVFNVPHSAMAAEMTSDYAGRTNLMGYKMMAARAGILIISFAGPLIFNSVGDLAEGFRHFGLMAGIFMTATGLWAFFATGSAPRVERPLHKFELRAEIAAVQNNRPFRTLLTVFLLQNIATGANATIAIYFLIYEMHFASREIALFLTIAGISGLIATPPWVRVAHWLGKKNAFRIGLSLSALYLSSLLFITPSLAQIMLGIIIFAGMVEGGNQLMPNSMVPDCVEADEAVTGERREGAIFGAWSLCLKLGMTLGALVASFGLSLFGFVGGTAPMAQSATALLGIRLMYAGLPAVLILAALVLLSRYDLTEQKFRTLRAEVAARRDRDTLNVQRALEAENRVGV